VTLDQWLKEKRMTQAEFAARIGVDQSTITRIIPGDGKRQTRRPSFELQALIMRETDGAVTANDFMAEAVGSADTAQPVTHHGEAA
jgi:transcriptional regulator with XRE-family HTH domain